MDLKKLMKLLFYRRMHGGFKFIPTTLCGKSLNLIAGSTRLKEDQDDAWWFYLAKHHGTIFDIGCNIGYTALLALVSNPNRKMILVDPNPKALQMAAANIIENDMSGSVQFLTAFVGNTIDEKIKFYTVGAGAAGSMYASHAETAASLNSFLEVKTITLDYLYQFYEISPDLVKIDVEGAETLVMQGAKELANATKCNFFIEMHRVENLGMEGAAQLMFDWCSEMDYKAWYLKTGEELTSAETIKNRGKCHLLLSPKEKGFPDYLMGVVPHTQLPNLI